MHRIVICNALNKLVILRANRGFAQSLELFWAKISVFDVKTHFNYFNWN